MTINIAAQQASLGGGSSFVPSSQSTAAKEPLVALYNRVFVVNKASSMKAKREVFNLRYRVLAEENSYLDPADFPEQMETDEYDARANHYLLVHRPSGAIAGTVRLIRPDAEAVGDELQFVHHCKVCDVYDRVPIMRAGEVSRFAVSREFRRRMTDGKLPDVHDPSMGHTPVDEVRRLVPYITLGLIQGMVEAAVENRLTHWVTVMEPTLVRLLQRFGIYFDKVGPLVALYGWRQPCARRLKDLLRDVEAERPDIWEILTDRGRLWEELLAYDR